MSSNTRMMKRELKIYKMILRAKDGESNEGERSCNPGSLCEEKETKKLRPIRVNYLGLRRTVQEKQYNQLSAWSCTFFVANQ